MQAQNLVHISAGVFILVFTTLGLLVSSWFFIGTFFVGLNLLQYGFTDFCPAEKIYKKLGAK